MISFDARPMVACILPLRCALINASASCDRVRPLRPVALYGKFS